MAELKNKKKRIAWFGVPAHGHINPTINLLKELREAGYDIFYFGFDRFRKQVEGLGVEFISCDGYNDDLDNDENMVKFALELSYAAELLADSILALDDMISEKICQIEPDLIVSDSLAYWGKLVAMKYHIPYVSSTTTYAFNWYSSWYLGYDLKGVIKLIASMPKMNRELKRLRIKGYHVANIFKIVCNDRLTNTIVYTSKEFQPGGNTFSNKYCFVGPSIRPIVTRMEKKAKKTIYISLGTLISSTLFYDNCIKAFSNTDYQVIISMGNNAMKYRDLPENIEVYESVDQVAVLSIADVFITHCGMNSASEGLYYEVPLILFPQTPEQWAVANRVKELGAGENLVSIEAECIFATVERVMNSEKCKFAAKQIADGFKKAGGTKKGKEFIEKLC